MLVIAARSRSNGKMPAWIASTARRKAVPSSANWITLQTQRHLTRHFPRKNNFMSAKRKLRYGMVGGGQGAFIGAVHRMAANLDGQIELVAGCFSSDPKNSRVTGQQLFLNASRVYSSYAEMA